jgi:hypothetical protein
MPQRDPVRGVSELRWRQRAVVAVPATGARIGRPRVTECRRDPQRAEALCHCLEHAQMSGNSSMSA